VVAVTAALDVAGVELIEASTPITQVMKQTLVENLKYQIHAQAHTLSMPLGPSDVRSRHDTLRAANMLDCNACVARAIAVMASTHTKPISMLGRSEHEQISILLLSLNKQEVLAHANTSGCIE
jgi:hypothetical protein